jgi:16S rRNA A1518/A1519 N6-dimethyltransferase RsmA/KsgA/DIM1 with predicted DNA glycosylase/AP lyase activity
VKIADRVVDQHFMLQKEVVDRMVAAPGSKTYGRLSVMLQFRYRMSKLFDVPRGAFKPPPEVTSSIVRMVPLAAEELPDVDPGKFARVVTAAFSQRRKTLRNALAKLLTTDAIVAAGVDPQARAETLAVERFVALARHDVEASAASGSARSCSHRDPCTSNHRRAALHRPRGARPFRRGLDSLAGGVGIVDADR